jgi:hypothetical protein
VSRVHLLVDTGVDDALAIVVAWLHPRLTLTGLTCAAGNVLLVQAVANTRHVLGVLGAESVPLSIGASRRQDGRDFVARSVHGPGGLAGLTRSIPEASGVGPAAHLEVAPDAALVCLAPMTTLLDLAPREVVATYARPGEANHAMDPVAAQTVRTTWGVHDIRPRSSLTAWPERGRCVGVAGLVDRLVRHQRRRGVGLGDAEALLVLAGAVDPVEELGRLLDP